MLLPIDLTNFKNALAKKNYIDLENMLRVMSGSWPQKIVCKIEDDSESEQQEVQLEFSALTEAALAGDMRALQTVVHLFQDKTMFNRSIEVLKLCLTYRYLGTCPLEYSEKILQDAVHLLSMARTRFFKTPYPFSKAEKTYAVNQLIQEINDINTINQLIEHYANNIEMAYVTHRRHRVFDAVSSMFTTTPYPHSKIQFIAFAQAKSLILIDKLPDDEKVSALEVLQKSALFNEVHYKCGVTKTSLNTLNAMNGTSINSTGHSKQ